MNYKDYAKKNKIDTSKPDKEYDDFERNNPILGSNKERRVKGWAILYPTVPYPPKILGDEYTEFNSRLHVYRLKSDAVKKCINYYGEPAPIVPCTITYKLPKSTKK